MDDRIKLNGLNFYTSIYGSPWPTKAVSSRQHPEVHPVTVSVELHLDLREAGRLDDLAHSVDYSQLSKRIRDACCLSCTDRSASETPYGVAERILDFCLKEVNQALRCVDIELEFPKLTLRAKAARVRLSWRKNEETSKRHSFAIIELPVHVIVGLRPHEREDKQPVIVTILLDQLRIGRRDLYFDFAGLERRISDFVEKSSYMTIEALTHQIARECFVWLDDPATYTVSVSLAKPAAIAMAQAPEIRVTRSLSDFSSLHTGPSRKQLSGKGFAALALGANLGDRFQNIELALRCLESIQSLTIPDLPSGELHIVDTSFLYESTPMYVESQPSFINCACLIETTYGPVHLLKICKQIEKTVGRVPSERFGPRAVDLDVITYGNETIDTRPPDERNSLDNLDGQLVVPHPRLAEREFVLRPLRDIIPEWIHPKLNLSIRSLLAKVLLEQISTLERVIPFPFSPELRESGEHKTPATQTYWVLPNPHPTNASERARTERRYTMATLNVTPDSFSDGGDHNALTSALAYARQAIAAGADIIDIGGYSTRPGAVDVPPSEEIARVVPVIHAIRNDAANERLREIPISIDTFRVDVASAALDAGANCINDVYAFTGGAEYYYFPPSSSSSNSQLFAESEAHFASMRSLARERGVPVIMMHSRGPADKNKDYSSYSSFGTGREVIEGVRFEISRNVLKATKGRGGLRRWQVIVDPGIGFSKDVDGNLQVLRHAGSLVEDGFLPPGASAFYGRSYPGPGSGSDDDARRRISGGLNIPFPSPSPYETPSWNPLAGYPLLIGASRKSFLGALLSVPVLPPNLSSSLPLSSSGSRAQSQIDQSRNPDEKEKEKEKAQPRLRPAKERDFATAAAITCALQQGAVILRVHAVQEMVDVVKVAAAIYSR